MIIYEVNEKKRTVVARFEGGADYWHDSLGRMFYNIFKSKLMSVHYDMYGHIVRDIIASYDNLVGRAVCHEDDTFDVEVGKQIAKNRLNEKFNRAKERAILAVSAKTLDELDVVMRRMYIKHGNLSDISIGFDFDAYYY